ncbi:MAG: creatininase family protein [Bacillota bacterium]
MVHMPGVSYYAELTLNGLKEINPHETICMITVSPLEVHGPHLPMGTDVFVGEKLQEEYCRALAGRYPKIRILLLPPLFAGCDPLPFSGSITVRAKTLENLLWDYVRSLADQGFRYLLVCDNHGGPSHQIAMEIVARRAWRRYRFALICPFNVIFRKMVRRDRAFLDMVGLSPGACGDDSDAHAGTNETSLMLASREDLVGQWQNVPPGLPPARSGFPALAGRLGKLLGSLGFSEISADLDHLANMLSWVNSPDKQPYMGSPGLADRKAGERMIKGHVSVAMKLVQEAMAGQKPSTRPMLWWIRAFRK